MSTRAKLYPVAVLCLSAWLVAGCGAPNRTSGASDLKASAINVLAGTRWTECHFVLSVGNQYYYNKRMFDFTGDGRMIVTSQAFFTDGACTSEISRAEVKKAFGRHPMDAGDYEHRYRVASAPNGEGVYDFDLIVYSQTTYTSMMIVGDHLMIGSAYNRDTDDPEELAMTGGTPETRTYAIGKLPLYYSLYRADPLSQASFLLAGTPCSTINSDKKHHTPNECQQLELEGVCKTVFTGGGNYDWWQCLDNPQPHAPLCESITSVSGVPEGDQSSIAAKKPLCEARPDCQWKLVVLTRTAVYRCLEK